MIIASIFLDGLCALMIIALAKNIKTNKRLLNRMTEARTYGFNRDEQIKLYRDRMVSAFMGIVFMILLGILVQLIPTIIKQLQA